MREPCIHPGRRLRYVGYLRGAHRVVCEVEHCGALLPLAEGGQAGRRPPNLDTSVQGARRATRGCCRASCGPRCWTSPSAA